MQHKATMFLIWKSFPDGSFKFKYSTGKTIYALDLYVATAKKFETNIPRK
jgi:hypothetical protein